MFIYAFLPFFLQEVCLGSSCNVSPYLHRPETKGFKRALIRYGCGSKSVISYYMKVTILFLVLFG